MTVQHAGLAETSPPADQRLVDDVREGLKADPPTLPPRWFYDEKGSVLFEQITRLEEYYPTRTEESILVEHAGDIAALSGASTLIELGAGTSRKTRLLLDALSARGEHLLFAPLDISAEVLMESAASMATDYPAVTVQAQIADFDDDFDLPGSPGSRLVVFLGSTIGNFTAGPRADFLARLSAALDPGDYLLLGADLVKDVDRLVRAYDDDAGVTAAFNRNLLDVLNRELDGDLNPEDFEHVSVWNAQQERVEMWLRAIVPVTAYFRRMDFAWTLPAGGKILTETSAKFHVEGLHEELRRAGLDPRHTWTDPAGDYSVTLATMPAERVSR
jgi:L-histidine N-alpha-methyltransferase